MNYTLLPSGPIPFPKNPAIRRRRDRRVWAWAVSSLLLISLLVLVATKSSPHNSDIQYSYGTKDDACPQYSELPPLSEEARQLDEEIEKEINSDAFFQKSLKKMQGAVKIPTESFDDMGEVGEDSRWEIFGEFHDYLAEAFPLV